MMKSIKYILSAAAAVSVALGASARYHAPYEYPRVFWDISTQQQIFESGNYARLITLQDGRLMAAAESYGPSGIKVCYSDDNGKHWSSPELIAPNPDKIGNAVPDLIQLSDGTLVVGYNPRPGSPYSEDRRFGIRCVRSTDNGKTWSDPIYIYDASHIFEDGCWEPSFLEMPDGELHCYFANEHPYTTNGDQEISVCRSFDGGLTWSAPERVTYRQGHRDGMPSAIITDAGDIVVIVEDNGHGGYPNFRATTMRCTVEQNWHDCWVSGSSPNRHMIFANAVDKQSMSAAPYIRKLNNGFTLASWQGNANGRGDQLDMFTAVGSKDALDFKQVAQPFMRPLNSQSLWNSVNVGFDNKVFALGSQGSIQLMEGYVLDYVQADYGTPEIDGSFAGETWTVDKCQQIVLGQATRTRSTHDFLYDNDNLYLFSYVGDTGQFTDKIDRDGVWLSLDVDNVSDVYPQEGMYRMFFDIDGSVKFYTGKSNKWVQADEVPAGINHVVKCYRGYYMLEVAVPWSVLGLDGPVSTDDIMRVNVEVNDIRANELRLEGIPDALPKQSWSWAEFRLNPGGSGAVSEVETDAASASFPVEYYNLQGIRVDNPERGIYIRRQGNKVTKEVIK